MIAPPPLKPMQGPQNKPAGYVEEPSYPVLPPVTHDRVDGRGYGLSNLPSWMS